MTIYDDRPKFEGIGWSNGEYKWRNFGQFLIYGQQVHKVCRTSWGAKRLAKRYNKNKKIT